jgi:hypothetical protein
MIPILLDVLEQSGRKPALTIFSVHNQLGDPADGLSIYGPPTGESVSSKSTVRDNSHIGRDAVREIIASDFFLLSRTGLPARQS